MSAGALLKPILKWPGGKGRELPRIRPLLPPFRTLVEPFAGGAALFFAVEPQAALLNDASAELAGFYRAVQRRDPAFRYAVARFDADRERVTEAVEPLCEDFVRAVDAARRDSAPSLFLFAVQRAAAGIRIALPVERSGELFARSVADKVRRLVRLEVRHEMEFEDAELPDHLETALQAGYYTAVRDRFQPGDENQAAASFLFLRTFCYGSMFRYSSDGRFNIPYGGISYNSVRLADRTRRLWSPAVTELLGRAEFTNLDFEAALDRAEDRLGADAFVFLDPPYDSEFSAYANRAFGRADHERLARRFARLPCPALLVIQSTDFIEDLYAAVGEERAAAGKPFFRQRYGKAYGYNLRGRNERRATHLVVGNYDPPAAPAVSPPASSRGSRRATASSRPASR